MKTLHDLLRAMLKLGLVEAGRLRAHYQNTPLGEQDALAAGRHLHAVLEPPTPGRAPPR